MNTVFDDRASRRKVLRAGMAGLAAMGTAIAMAGRVHAQAKISPKLVQYIEVSRKPSQNCANCAQFIVPNACKIVQGEIAPAGWCVSWGPAPKPAS